MGHLFFCFLRLGIGRAKPLSCFWGAVSGIASIAGMLLLISAYALAPATRLAPFIYCQIVIAAISGAVVLEDWPNMLGWTGILVIFTLWWPLRQPVERPERAAGLRRYPSLEWEDSTNKARFGGLKAGFDALAGGSHDKFCWRAR